MNNRFLTYSQPKRRLRASLWILLCLLAQTTTIFALDFSISLSSLTNHNTSAYSAYNQANFGANFWPTSWVSQSGATIPVDQTKMDASLNPVTPGHVSKTDVHTLIQSRPDLRWFAHATPWFGTSSHINIGLNNNTSAYIAAMITDMKNRGFNGVVIDWYGQGSQEDQATQKIKSYLASIPGNRFTYIIMVDKGVSGGLGTNNLQTQIQYCQANYFNDPNYEREPLTNGMPILMFFGVRSVVGASGMASLKASLGGNMVWVEQGTGYLGESWEDECFEWTASFTSGVNPSDPFNLNGVIADYSTIANSGKKAFGAMCSQFNGTLTKSVGWSMGKYLPSSNGVCMVQRAIRINAYIPNNITRMQWATWSDWEEGTQVETGIENGFAVTAAVNAPNVLSWTNTAGDASTVDHYEIYASSNGVTAALLCSVRTTIHQTNLTQIGLAPGNYQLYVDAVGKACVRDHLSPPVSAALSTAPLITQQPTNATVNYGGTATFTVTATGATPLSYTWYDAGSNVVGTSSNLVITGATQNNSYFAVITNQYGSITSGTVTLTVLTAPVVLTDLQPLSQRVWQDDPVSFVVVVGGVSPFSYQWTLNGQSIPNATNTTYSFNALPGTNYYQVTISNGQGSTNSSTATVVGVPSTFVNPANYNSLRITFSGYTNGETLVDFPVLVRLSTSIPGFSYSQFVSPANGADLRFAAANGRELPFQIDQWNPAGESLVWVQVPSITTSNDYITACWGNAADSAMPASNTNGAVWSTLSGSNNFVLVYHLNQSGFPVADSTLQYPASSGAAPTATTGIVGNGSAFSGSQFLDPGLVKLGRSFTVSAWVNISPSVTSEQTLWCNKQGGWNVAGFDFYVNSYNTGDGKLYFDTADGVGGNVNARTVANAVSFGQWHLLTGAMNGTNGAVHVYIDGVDQTIDTGVDTSFQVTNYVRCGALLTGSPGTSGGQCFSGTMDETRIESSVRSPAWIWASWATVANNSFANYGTIIPAAINLSYQGTNGAVVLTWPTGTLQSATSVTGPYSDVPGATSPYTVTPSGAQQFFRVRVQLLP